MPVDALEVSPGFTKRLRAEALVGRCQSSTNSARSRTNSLFFFSRSGGTAVVQFLIGLEIPLCRLRIAELLLRGSQEEETVRITAELLGHGVADLHGALENPPVFLSQSGLGRRVGLPVRIFLDLHAVLVVDRQTQSAWCFPGE